jgi:hypothetical protein
LTALALPQSILLANEDLNDWDVVPQNAELAGAVLFGLHYLTKQGQVGCFAKVYVSLRMLRTLHMCASRSLTTIMCRASQDKSQADTLYLLTTPLDLIWREWNGVKVPSVMQPVIWNEEQSHV